MSNFVEYITKDGERWDTIANKAYGDPLLFAGIIEANKSIVVSPIIQSGTRLMIPILEQNEIEVDTELLPPWKR